MPPYGCAFLTLYHMGNTSTCLSPYLSQSVTCEAEGAKDLFMCGTSSWTKENCNTGFVHSMCPYMCQVCPCKLPNSHLTSPTLTGHFSSYVLSPYLSLAAFPCA